VEESRKLDGIERALRELDAILGTKESDRSEVPFYGPTRLASMSETDQAMALQSEQARYEANPRASAVHFCLSAAVALLEVSQALLTESADPTPQERERQWKALVAYIKTAGRSAYRAASILTDRQGA
jgi:hypothetical protein